jgi:hypothetical protein
LALRNQPDSQAGFWPDVLVTGVAKSQAKYGGSRREHAKAHLAAVPQEGEAGAAPASIGKVAGGLRTLKQFD